MQYAPSQADSVPSLAVVENFNANEISAGSPVEASAITNSSACGSDAKNISSSTSKGSKVSVNVLNDIGNMLANLTDELDAMLEEEKRVGLNTDSE